MIELHDEYDSNSGRYAYIPQGHVYVVRFVCVRLSAIQNSPTYFFNVACYFHAA